MMQAPAHQVQEDEEGCAPPLPLSKCLETRDSISSIDSDVSLSYDRDRHAAGKPLEVEEDGEKDELAHLADLSSDSASDGGGKDSGCEVTPPEVAAKVVGGGAGGAFVPPDDELAARIVHQVEAYFSDAAIARDAFLLKHVRRNKEGYVSLKLVASFKRVKHLTKDWRAVAFALARSTRLQVNDAGTKLRRVAPLPVHDETTPSRTVVALRPPPPATVESVAELFAVCGDISLVRVLRPGAPIPSDVRHFVNKQPALAGGGVCAFVEFATSASARAALQLAAGDLQVLALNGPPATPERGKKKPKAYAPPPPPPPRQQRYSPPGCVEPVAWLQRRLSASSTEASFLYLPRRVSFGGAGGREMSDFLPRRLSHCVTPPPPPPPLPPTPAAVGYAPAQMQRGYMQRRLSASAGSSGANQGRAAQGLADNVLRMPRGPDGTRGFHQRAIQS